MKNVNNNPFPNLTSTDLLNLCLIRKEILGALIGILGYITLIISALGSRDLILQRSMAATASASGTNSAAGNAAVNRGASGNGTTPPQTPTPAEIAAVSSWLSLLTFTILGLVSFVRLREREVAVQTGSDKNPLYPNINIAAGFAIVIMGALIRAIGSQQSANQGIAIAIR